MSADRRFSRLRRIQAMMLLNMRSSGVRLPVDAFYPKLKLVIEYRERQHSEPVAFFDRKTTVSGVSRGKQRALYDQRRRDVIPRNGLTLVEFCYSEFLHGARKRLKRVRDQDLAIVETRLRSLAVQQIAAGDAGNPRA